MSADLSPRSMGTPPRVRAAIGYDSAEEKQPMTEVLANDHLPPVLRALSAAFPEFQKENPGPSWLLQARQDAFARLLARGLPTRRDEEWKYTSLRSFGEHAFSPVTLTDLEAKKRLGTPEIQAHLDSEALNIGIVGGKLIPLGSLPLGLTLMPLSEALSRREDCVRTLLLGAERAQSEGFLRDLHLAFLGHGAFLEVARGVTIERRIHLLHVADSQALDAEDAAYFSRCLLSVAEHADVQLVETFLSPGQKPCLVAPSTDIEVQRGARLRHLRVQREGSEAFHFGSLSATVSQDARFATLSVAAGACLARLDVNLALVGSGAEVTLDGLYLGKKTQYVDHHTTVDHRVPDAVSAQLYKGVLQDQARAVFNGKVLVRQDAQRTHAFQTNKTLLLSTDAEIDTKPELCIDADDVKCAHGAAVGPPSLEQLFYLESRGLTPELALQTLSQAFADEVLLKETVPGLLPRLRPLTMGYFL